MLAMRILALAAILLAPSVLAASEGQSQGSDFLFGEPRGSVGARFSWLLAKESGDIYQFFREQLTIDEGDFDAFVFGVDGAFALTSRVDLVGTFEISRASIRSEYRDFVDLNDLPIIQDTRLTILPVMGNLKFYLLSRGREVSRYAYVPRKVRPYAGGGVGFVWYELEQAGDFVDFVDLSIFTSAFHSSGWGFASQAFAGTEVGLTPRWFLSAEARYLWCDADLEGDFVGFDPIDLSGLRIGAGIHFSF
jgi:opacity protein-like surface antigen